MTSSLAVVTVHRLRPAHHNRRRAEPSTANGASPRGPSREHAHDADAAVTSDHSGPGPGGDDPVQAPAPPPTGSTQPVASSPVAQEPVESRDGGHDSESSGPGSGVLAVESSSVGGSGHDGSGRDGGSGSSGGSDSSGGSSGGDHSVADLTPIRIRFPHMRAVVQRVSRARSTPGGAIEAGLCVLLGVAAGDGAADADRLAAKVARLRIFEGEDGRFDRSVLDTGGAVLVVSQFTLIAETAKGNRPSFSGAARPEEAEPLYERFADALRALGVPVETGVFGARMAVELENDGPVTIVLE